MIENEIETRNLLIANTPLVFTLESDGNYYYDSPVEGYCIFDLYDLNALRRIEESLKGKEAEAYGEWLLDGLLHNGDLDDYPVTLGSASRKPEVRGPLSIILPIATASCEIRIRALVEVFIKRKETKQ